MAGRREVVVPLGHGPWAVVGEVSVLISLGREITMDPLLVLNEDYFCLCGPIAQIWLRNPRCELFANLLSLLVGGTVQLVEDQLGVSIFGMISRALV